MEARTLDDIEREIEEKKKSQHGELLVKQEATDIAEPIQLQIQQKMQDIFQETVNDNVEDIKQLADTAVKTEIEIKSEEVSGRKELKKSEIREAVTKVKTKEDEAQHERAKTILKSQGLTSQLPTVYRRTALGVGYVPFVIYLFTFGWIIQMFTFLIKGFITMVAECAERFAEVNKKFIDNDNAKSFDLRKSMFNILKWILIIGALVTVVVLLVIK